jgi:HK97 family phage portal protein
LFNIFKPKQAVVKDRAVKTISYFNSLGFDSEFSNLATNIYTSDYVNNAISIRANQISKFRIKSIIETNAGVRVLDDDISRLFSSQPNSYQSLSDFLSMIEYQRVRTGNCFIYPQYIEEINRGSIYRKYISFHVLTPNQSTIFYDGNSNIFIELNFNTGESYVLPYNEIVHLKLRRDNTLFNTSPVDTKDLGKTIKILNETLELMPKAINNSMSIKGILTTQDVISTDKLKKARDNFESHMFTSKGGIVATDLTATFTPVNNSPPALDTATIKFLKDIVSERYGVSQALLSGNFKPEEMASFVELIVEPFMNDLEQSFTNCLFSSNQISRGHKIRVYSSQSNLLSNQVKIDLTNTAINSGIMSKNEIRTKLWGLEPIEGGDVFLQSLNYVNVDLVDGYQSSKAKLDKGVVKNE